MCVCGGGGGVGVGSIVYYNCRYIDFAQFYFGEDKPSSMFVKLNLTGNAGTFSL